MSLWILGPYGRPQHWSVLHLWDGKLRFFWVRRTVQFPRSQNFRSQSILGPCGGGIPLRGERHRSSKPTNLTVLSLDALWCNHDLIQRKKIDQTFVAQTVDPRQPTITGIFVIIYIYVCMQFFASTTFCETKGST